MKKTIKHVLALFCTTLALIPTAISVKADVNKTTPNVSDVKAQALSTANYCLTSDANLFSDLSTNSNFHTASRDLLLANAVGADITTELNTYLDTVKTVLNEDGALNLDSSTGYILANYSDLLDVLAIAKIDATNFEGHDIVNIFNEQMKAVTSSQFADPNYVNPYLLSGLYATTRSYHSLLSDYDQIYTNLTAAIKSITTNEGVQYYGFSADNDFNVLTGMTALYNSDAEFAQKIDAIATKHTNTTADSAGTIYTDPETGAVFFYGALNPDSTALSLGFVSEYGSSENSAIKYNALITNFKSQTTAGAFTYYGDDSIYSSRDALLGLSVYISSLENTTHPFYVTPYINTVSNNETESNTVNETENNTETSAAPILDSAQTSDNLNLSLIVVLMAASLVTVASLSINNKKNNVL